MNAAKIRLAASGLIAGIAILGLTACSSSQEAAPTTSSTATKQPAPQAPAQVADPGTKAAKPAQPAANVLGPRSFGKLTIGMTYAEAKAAKLIGAPIPQVCDPYPLIGHNGTAFISQDRGYRAATDPGCRPGSR